MHSINFSSPYHLHGSLLLGTRDLLHVRDAVLAVQLNVNLVGQVGAAIVQGPGLDARLVGHDFQLSVEAGAARRAEEVLVDLARGTGDVVVRRLAYGKQIRC
jgi:hypothetical protein